MGKGLVVGALIIALVIGAVLFSRFSMTVRVSESHTKVESVAGGVGLARYLDWELRLPKEGVKQVNVVVTEKMRTECPVYDGVRKSLRWGMSRGEVSPEERIVYVWGREDVLQGSGAGAELTEYVAGCLKAETWGEEESAGPARLSGWEQILLMVQNVRIKYVLD